MALSKFQRTSYRFFGKAAEKMAEKNPKLEDSLRKARMPLTGAVYISWALANTVIVLIVAAAFSVAAAFLLPAVGIKMMPQIWLLVASLPFIFTMTAYMVLMSSPASSAKARGKNMNIHLPYALNYIAAMASAGINPDKIFASLARQKIYGEVATEALWIYKDIAFSGKDTVTAMKSAVQRSPSTKFQDFLQGAITTVTSGGSLQSYFSAKAQQFMWENRQEQKSFIDMMGLMAETYVTTAVAGPLFMIVMMSIMSMLGGQGPGQLMMIIYLLLPVANAGFVIGLQSMIPEV
ncbi:MAG: secretion system protein [Thermoplasmata archaeon HGW-Thermoplasmata-2]|nr:MAG: secretion system protein [Thermoplasmata archaeon HGW-Thermoplasmata-2]